MSKLRTILNKDKDVVVQFDEDRYSTINSSLLVVLAVAGNFVAETLNCKTQKALSENMLLKNTIIFFLIYFTLNLTNQENPHPIIVFRKAILVWIIFFIFNRTHYIVNLFIFALFIATYVISNYVKYYQSEKKPPIKLIQRLQYTMKILEYALIVSLVVGFLLYFNEKRNEYSGQNWDSFKFVFGVNKCKSLD